MATVSAVCYFALLLLPDQVVLEVAAHHLSVHLNLGSGTECLLLVSSSDSEFEPTMTMDPKTLLINGGAEGNVTDEEIWSVKKSEPGG